MTEKSIKPGYKRKLRNLTQYRELSDEDFEKVWEEHVAGVETNSLFENRIQRKIDEFANDYDLEDLKANDMLTLRALAQAFITLEDLERYTFRLRESGIDDTNLVKLDRINSMMSVLRKDISSMQNDLKITRKIRKGDEEESVVNYIENLKAKAKKFYSQKMNYIICPECKILLGTIWFMYPEEKNKLIFKCGRRLQNGSKCGHILTVTSQDLIKNKNSNLPEQLPESLL